MHKQSHASDNQDSSEKIKHIEEVAENVGRYARKTLDQNPEIAKGLESIVAAVRDEPVKASLFALGAGLFLGLFINRR